MRPLTHTLSIHLPCSDILRINSLNSDALYVKALCYYYQDMPDKANLFFQRALRADPDHRKSRLAIKVSEERRTSALTHYTFTMCLYHPLAIHIMMCREVSGMEPSQRTEPISRYSLPHTREEARLVRVSTGYTHYNVPLSSTHIMYLYLPLAVHVHNVPLIIHYPCRGPRIYWLRRRKGTQLSDREI